MTTLLILRHALTAWNQEGRMQGRIDQPLCDAGRAQAARWRLPPGSGELRWLASPLTRARDTARLLGLDPAPDPRLVEMSWGAWEGQRMAELRESGVVTADAEARGLDFRAPGGESPRDVQERLKPLLRAIAAEGRPTGAVAHNGVIRALYALAAGWDMRSAPRERLRDSCAHRFALAPDGTPSVAALNLPLEAEAERHRLRGCA